MGKDIFPSWPYNSDTSVDDIHEIIKGAGDAGLVCESIVTIQDDFLDQEIINTLLQMFCCIIIGVVKNFNKAGELESITIFKKNGEPRLFQVLKPISVIEPDVKAITEEESEPVCSCAKQQQARRVREDKESRKRFQNLWLRALGDG